ncbi:MAG: hypothetical protein ACRD94_08145, partial [Nitrosopumilaceae archaeon]
EKDKRWTDLKYWWKVKKGEEKGDPEKANKEINKIQVLLDLEVTDFDKEEPTKEVKEYTVAKAESLFTEEELKIVDEGQDRAIALRVIIADSTPRKYPALKGNQAGIGQIVNLTVDLVKERLKLK